jgi:ABC-type nitrate/sulfonate/bicarbonate transport system substrate-binding protein
VIHLRRLLFGLKISGLAGCIALMAAPMSSAQETIHVAYFPQIHDAASFAVRNELGKKYKLEYVRFLRYADAEIALSRGDIQLSSLGYSSAVNGALRDPQPAFVYVSGMSRGAINVVCRKDTEVKNWQDLKGKTFGVLTGGPAELFFDDALRLHNLRPTDVQSVNFTAPGPPLLLALQNKSIECTAVYEPFAATAVAEGNAYYPPIDLADNSFLGINGGMAVNADFLKTHAALLQEVVDVIVRSTALYNHDRSRLIADVKASGEFKPEVVETGAEHVILDSNLYLARLYKLAAAMKDLGFVRSVPPEQTLAKYFDYRFLEKATGKSADVLGRTQ